MRSWIAIIALPLTLLGGCSTLTLAKPDELYLATDYAPRPLTAPPVEFIDVRPATCEQGLGVEPIHGRFPVARVDFRVLPGMTVLVTQANGRQSGASELPIVSRWTWRVPNTVDWDCREHQRWSQSDLAVARALLYGSQASVGADPLPFGSIGTATAWGVSIRCLSKPKPSPGTPPDPCGEMPQVGSDPLVAGILQPFARGLGFRLRPARGPLSGTRLAQQVSELSRRSTTDVPTEADWDKAINCEDPSKWASSTNMWRDCRPPLAALVFNKAAAEFTGKTPLPLAPILRSDLTLLDGADPLLISAPRPLQALASPAFDLIGTAPGSGGGSAPASADAGPQRPIAGEAYQGFVSVDVLIPIRVLGRRDPLLVPITTTAETLRGYVGGDVVAVGRLAQWLPRYVHVREQRTCRFKPDSGQTPRDEIDMCAFIPAGSPRVYFRVDPKRGKGRFSVTAADLLLAPGDIVVLH